MLRTGRRALQRGGHVLDVADGGLDHLAGVRVRDGADELRALVPVELVIAAVDVDHVVLDAGLLDRRHLAAGRHHEHKVGGHPGRCFAVFFLFGLSSLPFLSLSCTKRPVCAAAAAEGLWSASGARDGNGAAGVAGGGASWSRAGAMRALRT